MDRKPHVTVASQLMAYVEEGRVTGLLGATTVATLYYFLVKAFRPIKAVGYIQILLSSFEVAPVGKEVLSDALLLNFPDYEDAILYEAARRSGATGIVTRDQKGFKGASVHIYTPNELLKMIQAVSL